MFFFSSRRRHTRSLCDWSSDVCSSDLLLFGASGTGAFESAVANLVSPGEPHLVVSAGSFGERWVAMTAAFGADEIGRASCRERVEVSAVGVELESKEKGKTVISERLNN